MPSVLRPHFLPKIRATFSRLRPPLAFRDEFGRNLNLGRRHGEAPRA
jgi:hypothetical protein